MYQDMTNVKVLALIETKDANGATRSSTDIQTDIDLYKKHVPAIKGFYFNQVGTDIEGPPEQNTSTQVDMLIEISKTDLKCTATTAWDGCGDYFVAFGVGEPLFDTSAVVEKNAVTNNVAVDLWVTLNDKAANLGVWTPYSWFSSLDNGYTFAAANWGALVTEVSASGDYGTQMTTTTDESILTQLFDRGYGYVYLTSKDFFNETSDHLVDLITGINKKKACVAGTEAECSWAPARRLNDGRFLQNTVDNGVSRTNFQCDDTLFECKPVCMETLGVVRNKVPDSKCAGSAPDQCSCRCFYDVYWTCENDAIVCKAKIQGGDEQTVGDLVCLTRGTPKPKWDLTAKERAAGVCAPLSVQREERPTQQCLAQYATEKELRQADTAETTQEDTAAVPSMGTLDIDIMEAGAPVSMLLAAALALQF